MNKLIRFNLTQIYYTFVVVYIVFVFIVIFFSINIFDRYRFLTNKTNSMSPLINPGSITLVVKQSSYTVGDIISFYALSDNKENIITHRIVREGGNVYITKGDANVAIDDTSVLPRLVIGKVHMIIPYLGMFISFAKTGIGLWLTILIPAIWIVGVEIYEIIQDNLKTS